MNQAATPQSHPLRCEEGTHCATTMRMQRLGARETAHSEAHLEQNVAIKAKVAYLCHFHSARRALRPGAGGSMCGCAVSAEPSPIACAVANAYFSSRCSSSLSVSALVNKHV